VNLAEPEKWFVGFLVGFNMMKTLERTFMVRALGLAAMACILWGGKGAAADVVIETVPVGNPGNGADTSGYGAVDHSYNIGKYEVTAGQYAAFLNAVAATDTYGLYHSSMASTIYGSGITQIGSSGSYRYEVDSAFVSRPVNYVAYWDACRFANWLNNGQGGAGTTEYGTYTLTSGGISGNTVARNAGTTWMITNENEWYKAAYYNPAAGSYYLYPTRTNTAPGEDLADGSGNNANYSGTPYPIQSPYYTTMVGEFQNSNSPYGTFDQGGNVFEWNESIISVTNRGLRGGCFDVSISYLQSDHRNFYFDPASGSKEFGFRVVQVPEPASLGIVGLAFAGLIVGRKGLRR
jgi:formylglycine-generating enzyme